MYSVEIEVVENGKKTRAKICPSGGEPYQWETEAEAWENGNMCYGVNFAPFWVVEA